jgi:hypothetical protein
MPGHQTSAPAMSSQTVSLQCKVAGMSHPTKQSCSDLILPDPRLKYNQKSNIQDFNFTCSVPQIFHANERGLQTTVFLSINHTGD